MIEKPHISYITCVYPPYRGGIGNVCYEQSRRIVKRDYPISVLTPCYPNTKASIPDENVKCIKPLISYGNAAVLLNLHTYLKGSDIIHFHYPFLGTDLVLIFICLFKKFFSKKKPKCILHYHMDLVAPTWMSRLMFTFTNYCIKPILLALSDRIIVTSEDYAKHSQIASYIQKHPSKVRVIPNGVDIDRFFPGKKSEKLLKRYNLSEKDKVILFVGGLDEAHFFKGLSILIHAVSQLPAHVFFNTKVLVVGDGNMREGYEKMVKKMGLDHVFLFAGSVTDKELPDIYRLCDFFVLPSINQSEAFGMVLIEAMACEKPVITSNLPGVRSVVDHNENGVLVEPMNNKALKNALYTFLTDSLLVETLGYAGLKKVRAIYDWDLITDKLEHVYKELV